MIRKMFKYKFKSLLPWYRKMTGENSILKKMDEIKLIVLLQWPNTKTNHVCLRYKSDFKLKKLYVFK